MRQYGCNIHAVVALAVLATGLLYTSPDKAHAAGWFNCEIDTIFEFGPAYTTTGDANTMQVHCANSVVTGVQYLGLQLTAGTYGTTQAEKQARFLSMATSALLSARRFRVYWVDTQCGSSANCRLVTAWSLYPP
jgi:hypothetical protein